MSTEWTTERLDALPEGTVIEWSGTDWSAYLVRRSTRGWNWEGLEGLFNSQAFTEQGSIRVVSVPIDALLADETVWVAEDAFVNVTHLAGPIRDEAETVIRAAVAHITGRADR